MPIGVKVMKRPTRETSYLRATLKGMALTFKHLFKEKVTTQYPEEKAPISPRWRGTHRPGAAKERFDIPDRASPGKSRPPRARRPSTWPVS